MAQIMVPRVFGGTLILTVSTQVSALPTLMVPAVFRSGLIQATYRNGEAQATYRNGEAQATYRNGEVQATYRDGVITTGGR